MAIHRGSRYSNTQIYNYIDSNGTFIPTISRRIPPRSLTNISTSYKTYVWKFNDRLDVLAYNEYGDSSLWWAILDANPQYMTEFDINIGDMIILPPYESIREALGNG